MVELDRADGLPRRIEPALFRAKARVGGEGAMLGKPGGDCRARDAMALPGAHFLCGLVERIAEVVEGDRVEHDAQRIGLVAQLDGGRGEDALARCTAPELDDLDLLFACPLSGDRCTAAVRAALRSLCGVRNARCSWDRAGLLDWRRQS